MPAKYKKRADGRYCTHVVIGRKSDGKPQRKTVYAKTIREMEVKAAELRRQVDTGLVVHGDDITVGEWAMEWLKTYKSSAAYNTQETYRQTISAHVIPTIGHMRIKDVRPYHIQRVLNEKREKGLTRAVVKIALTLNQIFKRAVENKMLASNPSDTVDVPRIPKTKKRALTENEKNLIMTAHLDIKTKAFLFTLLYAGIRRGEALSLSWSDIDLSSGSINVCKAHITKQNTPEIKDVPKSEAGNRTIPIPATLISVLLEYKKTATSEYVFPATKNKLMSKSEFRRFWDGAIKQLKERLEGEEKLPSDITPHIFRHTYATMLFYSGVDMKTAQYLLGHSTLSMTMEIYTHLDKSKTNEAADKLEKYITSSQNGVKIS